MSPLLAFDTSAEIAEALRDAARARRVAMGLSQAELSARSGVAIATLKRFEQSGAGSIATLLAIAEALDALSEFRSLFPAPEPRSLDDLAPARRARKPRQ